jgi:2-oxoglutarate ferredoxin oxidoreductase subunit delta
MTGVSEISRELKWQQTICLKEEGRTHSQKRKRAELRMAKIIINEEYCKGCTLCVNFCPQKTIQIANSISKSGYHPAEFSDPQGKCTGCTLCALMCPDAAITVYKEKNVVGEKK